MVKSRNAVFYSPPPSVNCRPKLDSKIKFNKAMDIHSKQTFLSEFQPKNLAKHLHDHGWIFAEYRETPEHRTDGKSYRAFLFRNKDRTLFGVKEFWAETSVDFRQMASRVIADPVYRESLISDDDDLRKIWKRH